MKYSAVLIGALLLTAMNAGAQANFASNVSLTPSPFVTFAAQPATPPAQPASAGALFAPASSPEALPASPAANPAEPPQEVQGVFEKYSYDLYAGYTFFRFYEVPGTISNMNGGNASAVYWFRDWVAADGEVFATYGSQPGQNSWQVFAGAGPRVRWVRPKGIDFWAHGLVGVLYITPQTPYGGQSAFAGLVGAGVDLNGHHRHMAIRIAIDGVASHYFNTYQISPKVSAGIVYKF
jgi:hypothetical protein